MRKLCPLLQCQRGRIHTKDATSENAHTVCFGHAVAVAAVSSANLSDLIFLRARTTSANQNKAESQLNQSLKQRDPQVHIGIFPVVLCPWANEHNWFSLTLHVPKGFPIMATLAF